MFSHASGPLKNKRCDKNKPHFMMLSLYATNLSFSVKI